MGKKEGANLKFFDIKNKVKQSLKIDSNKKIENKLGNKSRLLT